MKKEWKFEDCIVYSITPISFETALKIYENKLFRDRGWIRLEDL